MNKLPCIEPEKPRTPEPSRFKFCKCGHYKYNHLIGVFSRNECEECMCNKYKELGKFTLDEILQLKPCDNNDRNN